MAGVDMLRDGSVLWLVESNVHGRLVLVVLARVDMPAQGPKAGVARSLENMVGALVLSSLGPFSNKIRTLFSLSLGPSQPHTQFSVGTTKCISPSRLFSILYRNQSLVLYRFYLFFFFSSSSSSPLLLQAYPTHLSKLANSTHQTPSADQTAAALYAEQYQQYTQQYQAWLAANPGYQQSLDPSVTPAASAAAPAAQYSAYYSQYPAQSYSQPPPPGTQQQLQTAEEQYSQQYAAYYSQYGYTAPATSTAAQPGAPPATTQAYSPYNQHQGYYQQPASDSTQSYPYSVSAPGAQVPAHAYSGYQAAYPGAPAPTSHPVPQQPASVLTPLNYSFSQQQQQQQQPTHTFPPNSFSASLNPGQPQQQPQQQQYSYRPQSGPSLNGAKSNHHAHSKQTPAGSKFDFEAFQRQKHQESEKLKLQKKQEERDKQHIQQKLRQTTLSDKPVTAQNPSASTTMPSSEKPAYLSVKSKKVKTLTTNVLESKSAKDTSAASIAAITNGTTTTPAAAAAAAQKEGWPQSLKDYVQRVFEAIDDEDRDEAQLELRNIVSKYHAQNKLWEVDWDNMDIPSRFLRKKSRKRNGSPDFKTLGAEELAKREKRMRRFEDQLGDKPRMVTPVRVEYTPPVFNSDVIDWDEYTIVGTSTQLEKNYLRLTSAPDPSTVRPVHILKKTLELLKDRWRRDQNYAYICDQLKSVRQDLTVQRIKNDFTVTVYEIHARIALEKGDLGEYNQCQTQLKQLYAYKLKGNVMEFTAYRILYLLHTRNPSDIIAMLASLTPEQKQDPAVKHALQVRTALASSNYHSLFKLYVSAPNMGGYLMDQFVERERVEAMKVICKAYRPSIDSGFLVSTLGFINEDECLDSMKSLRIRHLLSVDQESGKKILDTKAALPYLVEAGKKYQTIDIKGQI